MADRTADQAFRRFYETMFERLPGGTFEARAVINGEQIPTARVFTSSVAGLLEFSKKHGRRDQNEAAYFGVCKRKARDGKKEGVLGATALWADIDTKKLGFDMTATARALFELPGVLRPSALVNSGGGLHAYWCLDEPVMFTGEPYSDEWTEQVNRIEDANRELAYIVAGDHVHDITRVLRMPHTYNTKRQPALCAPVYSYHWDKKNLDELRSEAERFPFLLSSKGFVLESELPPEEAPPEQDIYDIIMAGRGKGGSYASRINKLWELARPGGGRGYVGLDEALSRTVAMSVLRRDTEQGTVDVCLSKLREIETRYPGEYGVDVHKETGKILEKRRRFEQKSKQQMKSKGRKND